MTAIWPVNAIRLTALVAVGALVSPAVAVRGFPVQAGWPAFNVVPLGLVLVASAHGSGVARTFFGLGWCFQRRWSQRYWLGSRRMMASRAVV